MELFTTVMSQPLLSLGGVTVWLPQMKMAIPFTDGFAVTAQVSFSTVMLYLNLGVFG